MASAVAVSNVAPSRGILRSAANCTHQATAPIASPGASPFVCSSLSPARGSSIMPSSVSPAGTIVHNIAAPAARASIAIAARLPRDRIAARVARTIGDTIAASHA
jgi:hypothetical protein